MNLSDILQLLEDSKTGAFLWQIFYFLMWSGFILLFVWAARKGINRTIADTSNRYRARKFVRFAGYLLILLLAVVSFTGKIQYFGISIGLISAGIAFALQEVILSLAGWISIFSNNLYQPGDRIELKGVKGDVIDVGLTKTTLMEIGEWVSSDNYTGRIVQISNAFVFKEPVFNYSRDFPFVWDEIVVPIRYGSDLTLAASLIQQVAAETLGNYHEFARKHWDKMVLKYLIEHAKVESTLSMKLTDNWMEFTLRYVVAFDQRRTSKHLLFTHLWDAIQKTEGKVQLASATFEIVEWPEMKVNTAEK